jgi:membrane fusion protein, multidrug efflux system
LSNGMRISWAIIATLTAAACSTGGEAVSPPPGGGRGGPAAGVPVTIGQVEQKPMPITINAIGTVEAYTNVAVRAQTTGELISVNFREGDDVRKGQVLFTLDRRPLEAALAQAEANFNRDTAQAQNARAQAARAQDLAARGIATREQLDQMTANAAALDATVAADRAAVENARVELQYATIMAPIAGRTGALMVHAGNLVRANDTTPLVVINQIAPINVTFGIPESQLPAFKRYMAQGTVSVTAQPPNETAAPPVGRITFIDNAVDQTTGTIKLKGTFANEKRHLWPGQFVNVVVTLTTDPRAVVVPTPAVQTGQQGQFVFVVKPDQTVELRPVTTSRSIGSETVIDTGLKPGETVVTDGQLRLTPGARISVKNAVGTKAAS